MGIFKRKPDGPWWVRFRIGGKDIFRSARTTDRGEAEEFEQSLRNLYWRQVQLGEHVHTWGEAVARLKREARWSVNTQLANERSFARFALINDQALTAVDRAGISDARSLLLADDLAPASVNRHMAVFGQVLRASVDWGWLKEAPRVSMVSVPEREATTLTAASFVRLLAELPPHLKPPAVVAITTGLRMANVRDLTWSQIDLEHGRIVIPASESKTRRALSVPLSVYSAAVLASIEPTPGTDRVFTYRPFLPGGNGERGPARPITGTLNAKAFRKARKRAGVTARWHDLRHTFATWAASAGTPDRALQALGGWTSPAMLTRYAHLSTGDTRSWSSAAGANAVAAIESVMPDVMKKVLELQGVEVVPTHRIELWTPSLRNPESPSPDNKNQRLTDDRSRNDTGETGPSRKSRGAKPVARIPGKKR